MFILVFMKIQNCLVFYPNKKLKPATRVYRVQLVK